jgi:integrase
VTVHDYENTVATTHEHMPWNKGKVTGAKPPFRPKHVWSIRSKLQLEGRIRDLAMFNLAIDSKLRGCDVVALRVGDIAPNGNTIDRATIRQRKTGQSVKFELTEQTRQTVDDYLAAAGRKSGDFLFAGSRSSKRSLTTRQYCPPCFRMGRQHWLGPAQLRDSLASSNKGDANLSPHRQFKSRPASSWSQEDREHGSLPRH